MGDGRTPAEVVAGSTGDEEARKAAERMSRDATQQPAPGKDVPQPPKPGDSATTAPLSDTENAKRVADLMMDKKFMDSVIDAVNQDGLWKNRSKYSGEKLSEQGKELETRFKAALQEQLAKHGLRMPKLAEGAQVEIPTDGGNLTRYGLRPQFQTAYKNKPHTFYMVDDSHGHNYPRNIMDPLAIKDGKYVGPGAANVNLPVEKITVGINVPNKAIHQDGGREALRVLHQQFTELAQIEARHPNAATEELTAKAAADKARLAEFKQKSAGEAGGEKPPVVAAEQGAAPAEVKNVREAISQAAMDVVERWLARSKNPTDLKSNHGDRSFSLTDGSYRMTEGGTTVDLGDMKPLIMDVLQELSAKHGDTPTGRVMRDLHGYLQTERLPFPLEQWKGSDKAKGGSAAARPESWTGALKELVAAIERVAVKRYIGPSLGDVPAEEIVKQIATPSEAAASTAAQREALAEINNRLTGPPSGQSQDVVAAIDDAIAQNEADPAKKALVGELTEMKARYQTNPAGLNEALVKARGAVGAAAEPVRVVAAGPSMPLPELTIEKTNVSGGNVTSEARTVGSAGGAEGKLTQEEIANITKSKEANRTRLAAIDAELKGTKALEVERRTALELEQRRLMAENMEFDRAFTDVKTAGRLRSLGRLAGPIGAVGAVVITVGQVFGAGPQAPKTVSHQTYRPQ